jgi:hypothetical protein
MLMNWIEKLFADTAVSSTEIASRIVKAEAELASLGERLGTAEAAALRATESGRGNRAERVKVDGLRADLAHGREHLEALRRAYAEAIEAEQLAELNARWDAAQAVGVRLLAAAGRMQQAVDVMGREYATLVGLLSEFDSVLPARAHDSYPLPIDRHVALRLGAQTNGALGLPPPIAPADVLVGAGNLVERVRDVVTVALRIRPHAVSEKASNGAVEAPLTGE